MNINDNLRSRSLELIKYYQSHTCDSSNISTFINKMSELMIDEESFKECRLSFIAEDFQQFIIKMCLLSPITDIGKLRAMGFSTVLDYLSTTKDEYINNFGKDAWEKLLNTALYWVEFLIKDFADGVNVVFQLGFFQFLVVKHIIHIRCGQIFKFGFDADFVQIRSEQGQVNV